MPELYKNFVAVYVDDVLITLFLSWLTVMLIEHLVHILGS